MALNGKQLPEKPLYPSPTAGNGKKDSISDSRGQGRKSNKLYYRCKQCGAWNNINTTDSSGGSQSGNGGNSKVTKTAGTGVTDLVSDSYVDGGTQTSYPGTGDQTVKRGCWLCGSLNSR